MGLKQLSLFLLAIGTIVATTVAITMSQRDPVLIPTLNLQGKQLPTSGLLGTIVSDVDGVRLLRYSASEAAAGIVLTGDEHNIFTCAQSGPLLSNSMQGDAVTRFWGYEYSGNEVANRRAGKVGRELFDGQFFISQGENAASGNAYNYLNTLTTIAPNKMYYFMQERDLGFMCGQGILGTLTCGNGTVEAGEQCDDNNVVNGDGCSNFCQVESSSSASVSSQTSSFTIFRAHLDDSQNTSPTGSSATGDGFFSFNATTNVFTYDVAYSGLTSTVTSGHIHGPAARGQDAGVVINLNPPSGTSGHLTGSVVLTGQQIADLFADHWYVNMHSQNHGAGEIRGQIEHLPSSSSSIGGGSSSEASTSSGGSSATSTSSQTSGTSSQASSSTSFGACPFGFSCVTASTCDVGTTIGACGASTVCCVVSATSSSSNQTSSTQSGGSSSAVSSTGGSSSISQSSTTSTSGGSSATSSAVSSSSTTSTSGGSSATSSAVSSSSTTSTSGGSSATSSAVSSSSTTSSSGSSGSSSVTSQSSQASSTTSGASSATSATSSSSLAGAGNCGNGIPEAGEECDDGNTNNNDGCIIDVANSYECKLSICGDGYEWTQAGGTEECDDGNTVDGDGCFANCTLMIPPDA